MSVTLLEVLAAAGAQQACLTGENSGFVTYCLAQALAAGPRNVGLGDVVLTPEGDVCVLSGPKATSAECETALRKLLRQLLVGAHRPARAVVRIAETESRGLGPLALELQGALVPLNRPAARRSLARLCRDTERAQKRGLLEKPRVQVEKMLAGWMGEQVPRQASASVGASDPSGLPRTRLADATAEVAKTDSKEDRARKVPNGQGTALHFRTECTPAQPEKATVAGREEATVPQPRVRRTLDVGTLMPRNDQTPFLGTQVVTMMERPQKTDPSLFGTLEVRPEHRGGGWFETSEDFQAQEGVELGQREVLSEVEQFVPVAPEDVDIFQSLAPGDVEMLEPTPPPIEIGKSHLDSLLSRFNAALLRSDREVRHDLKGMCDVELTPHADAWLSNLTPPPVAAEITEKPAAGPDVTPKGGFVVALLTILVMGGAAATRYRAELTDVVAAAAGRGVNTHARANIAPGSQHTPVGAKGICQARLKVRGVREHASVTVRPANANSQQPASTKPGPNPSFELLKCGEPLEVIVARAGEAERSWKRIPVPGQSLTPKRSADRAEHTIFAD